MSYHSWGDYVSVAERRRQAERERAKLRKQGRVVEPVTIAGPKIAQSFWGMAWCTNLERYSDYASRLPRGRSYVRNGFVVDLQIAKGEVAALVVGSEVYKVKIAIAPVAATRWVNICRDCAGSIDSVVELLQGRLAKSVMDRVCRQEDGLFPSPEEIKLSCSCPDWADMCKHVAAVLYGIGARFDEKPQLLFALRGVDENELLAEAGQDFPAARTAPDLAKVLDDSHVAALFGLDMADVAHSDIPARASPKQRVQRSQRAKESGSSAGKQIPAAKKTDLPRIAAMKIKHKQTPVRSRKKRARRA